ncbi:MAG: ATP-dependent zinc metalloprotease FtsH [Clostridia bacterium]|nr:ATP-dependent zinc metalloprotease FtsH [Clostridia bacterium]
MKNKGSGRIILFYLAFFLVVILIAGVFRSSGGNQKEIDYGTVVQKFQKGEIHRYYVDTDYNLYLSDNVGTEEQNSKSDAYKSYEYIHHLADVDIFTNDLSEIILKQTEEGTLVKYDYEAPSVLPWWVAYIPYLLVLIALGVFFWLFISRTSQSGGGIGIGGKMNSFSRARTKLGSDEKNKVLFSDVAGADEEKEELQEVVEFLKNPDKYSQLGAKIPRGVLLIGAPGTGKTLLAKAVAGESGVPFYSISGSDFVEMYVGVGASRVRDLFETAKKTAPCIVFIDEIDAVGRQRGAGLGGSHDEREQTLNQLLVEMDGFGVNDGVIVMAATNRPDILDNALLRPGRFDRQITVNYPDIKGREEILKVHARGKPLGTDVSLATIARSTAGFTGADLANLLNEAALHAARKKKAVINTSDIEEAMIKVMVGPQKKSKRMSDKEKLMTAYHEAGHAIVHKVLPSLDPVHQISIIPSGRALGYTLAIPETDKMSQYKNELLDVICSLLGGRAAEQLKCGDISGGASNDMQRATDIARSMVTRLGMSELLGPIVYSSEGNEVFLGRDFGTTKNYSEKVSEQIDAEIHRFVFENYERALKILRENDSVLEFIAQYLVKHEIMDGDQFDLCFTEGVTEEMLDSLRERKKTDAEEENEKRRNEEKKNSDPPAPSRTRRDNGDNTEDVFSDDLFR